MPSRRAPTASSDTAEVSDSCRPPAVPRPFVAIVDALVDGLSPVCQQAHSGGALYSRNVGGGREKARRVTQWPERQQASGQHDQACSGFAPAPLRGSSAPHTPLHAPRCTLHTIYFGCCQRAGPYMCADAAYLQLNTASAKYNQQTPNTAFCWHPRASMSGGAAGFEIYWATHKPHKQFRPPSPDLARPIRPAWHSSSLVEPTPLHHSRETFHRPPDAAASHPPQSNTSKKGQKKKPNGKRLPPRLSAGQPLPILQLYHTFHRLHPHRLALLQTGPNDE